MNKKWQKRTTLSHIIYVLIADEPPKHTKQLESWGVCLPNLPDCHLFYKDETKRTVDPDSEQLTRYINIEKGEGDRT